METFFEKEESADAAVAVLEWVDALELVVESEEVVKVQDLAGAVLF